MGYKSMNNANEHGVSKNAPRKSRFQKGYDKGFKEGQDDAEMRMFMASLESSVAIAKSSQEIAMKSIDVVSAAVGKVPEEQALEGLQALLGFVEKTAESSKTETTKRLDMMFQFVDAQVERVIPLAVAVQQAKASNNLDQVEKLQAEVKAAEARGYAKAKAEAEVENLRQELARSREPNALAESRLKRSKK